MTNRSVIYRADLSNPNGGEPVSEISSAHSFREDFERTVALFGATRRFLFTQWTGYLNCTRTRDKTRLRTAATPVGMSSFRTIHTDGSPFPEMLPEQLEGARLSASLKRVMWMTLHLGFVRSSCLQRHAPA